MSKNFEKPEKYPLIKHTYKYCQTYSCSNTPYPNSAVIASRYAQGSSLFFIEDSDLRDSLSVPLKKVEIFPGRHIHRPNTNSTTFTTSN